MDWFRAVNNYCERTDPGYWSEPVNALTNAAFILAAIWGWRIASAAGDTGGRVLAAILAAIGVGSYLFHTHAQIWSLYADVIPIQVFILAYLYLATVRFFAVPWWGGALAVLAFIPYAAVTARGLGALVGSLNGSIGYVPVPILIAAYAVALRHRRPEVARGLAIGAGILALSLVFRTLDAGICAGFPLGTHFLWHLLNAAMLGWMIGVVVEGRGPASLRR
jgi:hypothetical protein